MAEIIFNNGSVIKTIGDVGAVGHGRATHLIFPELSPNFGEIDKKLLEWYIGCLESIDTKRLDE